jgi:hexosaminidase
MMKMKSALCLSLFASVACAVWPLPSSYEHGDALLWLGKDVVFRWYQVGANNVGPLQSQPHDQKPFVWATHSNAAFDEQNGSHDSNLNLRKRYSALQWPDDHDHAGKGPVTGDDIVNYAVKSAWDTLFKHSFYPWKFHTREWKEPAPNKHSTYITHIDIHQLARDPKAIAAPLAGQVDESYSLTLSASGSASVSANSSIGIARGLTTLTQLFFAHSSHAVDDVYTPLAPVSIVDSPKFPHRGINLDVSRNFFPVADIKRQIDAVAYNKMNRLHLHATDSQAWPLEIPALPALAHKGAYRPHMVYSAGDFAELQRYAALQGVQLITELDMPGHTSSIHHAFPDLIAAFDVQPNWNDYAAEPPSGTLKLNSTAVDVFLDTLFADLLPRVAPYAAYFHTGGDEVNRNAYTLDDTVKSSDERVLQPLMQRFVERNHARVRAHGLTPVVWEEMLLEWNVTLGDDVVVQAWQSDEAARQIVERGYKALVGNYKFWVRIESSTPRNCRLTD